MKKLFTVFTILLTSQISLASTFDSCLCSSKQAGYCNVKVQLKGNSYVKNVDGSVIVQEVVLSELNESDCQYYGPNALAECQKQVEELASTGTCPTIVKKKKSLFDK